MQPQFQPFSALPPAFTIGLKPVDRDNFLHIDLDAPRYLAEKQRLYETQFEDVFMAEPDTDDAQLEVFDLIADAIGEPDRARNPDLPPLADIALHVQDDLVIMRRDDSGWRLVAVSLCFPSSWNLAEKFGRPLEAIHAPVPGMADGMDVRIRRIFDALRPETPLWRHNWALDGDGDLRHDRKERQRGPDYKKDMLQGDIWLRAEYQTLHKLPASGDILFTIKILPKPLIEIAKQANGPEILSDLLYQYHEIGEEGLSYKGISKGAEKLLAWLEKHKKVEASSHGV